MQPLRGKVAIVTGGARGLGRAYVLRLARLGAHVVINDIDLNAAAEFHETLSAPTVMAEAEAYDVQALGIQADVTVKAEVNAMVDQVMQTFDRVDILVNNAGGALRPVPNNSAATEDEVKKVSFYLNIMSL